MKLHPLKHPESEIANRSAFTLIETGVAMAILAVAMLLVVQIGYWSMRERASSAARFAAIEHVANVLEAARCTPWESLTDEWAESQRVPDDLADQLPEAALAVKVDLDASQPLTKRVIVELRWMMVEGVEVKPLRMEGLFSRRSAMVSGGNP